MTHPKHNHTLFYISLVLALPVFWAARTFMDRIQAPESDATAFAATLAFFFLLLLGWYAPDTRQEITPVRFRKNMLSLGGVCLVSFIVLALHADLQFGQLPGLNLLLFWLPFILLSLALGALFRFFFNQLEQRVRLADSRAAQSQSELKLLQSQLSPHFLFNTLNSLYGLSINDHKKVPALLLKLSELLRYSVYEIKETFVPLDSEIAYIQNYIDFEKLRIGERLQLSTAISGQSGQAVRIAPMLLIVFIENAFKHAKNSHSKTISVAISLQVWENRILFAVKNSYEEQAAKQRDNYSGVGLDNTQKRLEVLYPGEHQLKIETKDGQYIVNLQIPVK